MSRRTAFALFFLVLLTFPAACESGLARSEPAPYPPRFEASDCWFALPAGAAARCGAVRVPENRTRGRESSPAIRIAVAIFSKAGPAARAPLFFLSGGPGDAAIDPAVRLFAQMFAGFLDQRDLVVIDQRGTGHSEPSLDCPTRDLAACRQRLVRRGVDLAAYTTAENAADIDDVRRALGYERIDLIGGSYGTLLAQAVIRDHPRAIRSAILDSSAALPQIVQLQLAEDFSPALQALFDACRADTVCNADYPELGRTFEQLVTRLNTSPAHVRVGARSGGSADVTLSGGQFALLVWQSLYFSEAIPHLPAMIQETADGDTARFARLIEKGRLADVRSEGFQQSIECAEMAPFMTPADLSDRTRRISPSIRETIIDEFGDVFERCRIWNVPPADRRVKEPLRSDTPVLLLAGALDPATSPRSARATAATLTRHYLFVFPDSGHGVFRTSACARELIAAFLADPHHRPDVPCFPRLTGPAFVTRERPETQH